MNIAILGSTGSIGNSTLEVIRQNKKDFEINLLTAKSNHKLLLEQCREFNPEKADILRYELLYRFGGLYIDADIICLKPLNDLLLDNLFLKVKLFFECFLDNLK